MTILQYVQMGPLLTLTVKWYDMNDNDQIWPCGCVRHPQNSQNRCSFWTEPKCHSTQGHFCHLQSSLLEFFFWHFKWYIWEHDCHLLLCILALENVCKESDIRVRALMSGSRMSGVLSVTPGARRLSQSEHRTSLQTLCNFSSHFIWMPTTLKISWLSSSPFICLEIVRIACIYESVVQDFKVCLKVR